MKSIGLKHSGKLLRFAFFCFIVVSTFSLYSQDVKNISQPEKYTVTKVQDIKSPEGQLKLPPMSASKRDSLVKPTEGMVIFNTTIKRPQYYDGEAWFCFHNERYIGERFGGGIICYIDTTGKHGLIAAPANHGSVTTWGFFENQVEAFGKLVGTGKANTEKIAAASDDNQLAARICSNLVLNGYDDWYLPSKDELNLMYVNLKKSGIGKFNDDVYYWTSSETDFNNAWIQDFKTGVQKEQNVNRPHYVRAIRTF